MTAAYVYLGLSILLLTNTLPVLFPRVYPHLLGSVMAVPSMLLAFFIPQFILLGVAVSAVAGYFGAFDHGAGQLGLLLHVLSWGLLTGYLWRMQTALPELDGKVVQDVDQPFCDGLTEDELRDLKPGQITWRPTLTLRIPEMLEVDVTSSVVFRQIGRVRLRVDIYRSRTASSQVRPAVVYIHGGGWMMGNRRQSKYMMYELATAGWVVFAISYRFVPRYSLTTSIEDCKAGLAWAREHAAEYGADGNQIIVMGGSAGGHLAAMVALTPNDPRFQPGFEQADTRVQGGVIMYGVPDFEGAFEKKNWPGLALLLEQVVLRARYRKDPDRFRTVQPVSYCSPEAPPLLLVHGTHDSLVSVEQSRAFFQRLQDAGACNVHLLEVPYGVHAFEVFPSPLHQRAIRVMIRFMEGLRRPPRQLEASTTEAARTGAQPDRTDTDPAPTEGEPALRGSAYPGQTAPAPLPSRSSGC